MNKNIKLAVAGAVLALSASAANAGIIIPAGDWTLDINGNVNGYANFSKLKGTNDITGGIVGARQAHQDTNQTITTGLLPAWIGFTGKTRQNDLDVEFTISLQPGIAANDISGDGAFVDGTASSNGSKVLNRQTYLSFGDKSWGSIKIGKDLGVFASDAILNDMTLLGVGSGVGANGPGTNTTNGGIGTGYIYAAWKGQIAYTTPNFNGFQATVALTNPNQPFGVSSSVSSGVYTTTTVAQDRFGVEGKASYSFSGDSMSGKLWVSGATYDVTTSTSSNTGYTATVADLGLNVNAGPIGLTGYYYRGEGVGTTLLGSNGVDSSNNKRDSDGGYLQATYKLPTATKIGLAYGVSKLDKANASDTAALVSENNRITLGAYHPITKHLNLVAEYNDVEAKSHNGLNNKQEIGSLGAILFF
ncbi:porin [Candidatus Methylopumilus planktonicus]|uniref:porin n=1 Tax=Candidatus Methylopumilus planktonicus TaxID=1581557 RepID=UPI00111ECDAF|nr:porin [Candidatus Methylopumilus planktonicus]QDD00815.1 porin [Candidatus Methylopumilus planktonicus]